MTVVSPGIVTGTTYFITVKTPSGTSPTSANDVFTFSPLVPTVSAVNPNSGPNAGGTSIVITGTGFVNGATVSFIKQSTGCGGFGAISANNVTVVGSNTITANSPSVSAAAPYYVYVTTPSGPVELLPGLHLHRLRRLRHLESRCDGSPGTLRSTKNAPTTTRSGHGRRRAPAGRGPSARPAGRGEGAQRRGGPEPGEPRERRQQQGVVAQRADDVAVGERARRPRRAADRAPQARELVEGALRQPPVVHGVDAWAASTATTAPAASSDGAKPVPAAPRGRGRCRGGGARTRRQRYDGAGAEPGRATRPTA